MESWNVDLRDIQRSIHLLRSTKHKRKNPAGIPHSSLRPFSLYVGDIDGQDIFGPYKRLLNPAAKTRISVSQFLDLGSRAGGFFSTDLIECSESLENISIKESDERDLFLELTRPEHYV